MSEPKQEAVSGLGLRLLPELTDRESAWKRGLFAGIAILITIGFGYFILSYTAAAHPGVDQNGYQVGGKQLALTGSTGIKLSHPLQYLGAMWVIPTSQVKDPHAEIWYYPKYPIGLPLLDAIPLWINWERGKDWIYLISPISVTLSLLAMFFFARELAGSFMGILGMLLLGMNPTTLALANNSNSHAPDLLFVTAGMYFLLRWWRTGTMGRGILAGFLLGFAVTIRYSEGLLILPLLFAALCMLPYRELARVSGWRFLACLSVALVAIALRLRLDLHRVNLLAIGAAVISLLIVIPIWRIGTAYRSLGLWRDICAAALVGGVVVLNQPAQLSIELGRNPLLAIQHNPALHCLIILSLSLIALLLFVYAPRGVRRTTAPVLAWMAPVLWLVGFNWFAMHSITGYDATNESTGFQWASLEANWEFAVKLLYDFGAFLLFPVAVLGIVVMARRSIRLSLLLVLWLVPGVLIYAAYYWAPHQAGLWYLRFFLTLIPGILLAALWFLRHGAWWRAGDDPQAAPQSHGHSVAMPIACGLLVAFSTWIAARSALPYMERESASNLNLAFTGEQIVRHVPAGSILFTSGNGSLLNFIQWKGDYELYPIDAFNSRLLLGLLFKLADNGQASPLQAARENYLTDAIYKGKSSADLVSEQNRIMRIALRDPQRPRRVFFISDGSVGAFKSKFLAGGQFDAKDVCNWREPATVLIDPAAPALAMGGWGRNRTQQSWHIIEIVTKTPATSAPATAPSTQAQQQ